MKIYKIEVWNLSTNQNTDGYEFEALTDAEAIQELESNLTHSVLAGKYEVQLFQGTRFVKAGYVNEWH